MASSPVTRRPGAMARGCYDYALGFAQDSMNLSRIVVVRPAGVRRPPVPASWNCTQILTAACPRKT